MTRPLNERAADLQVVHDVAQEQQRQRKLQKQGRFQFVAGDVGDDHAFHVLVEEHLEAHETIAMLKLARFMNDAPEDDEDYDHHLYTELIQVAAVTQSWARGVLARIRGDFSTNIVE